jgi:hypothetical protein
VLLHQADLLVKLRSSWAHSVANRSARYWLRCWAFPSPPSGTR